MRLSKIFSLFVFFIFCGHCLAATEERPFIPAIQDGAAQSEGISPLTVLSQVPVELLNQIYPKKLYADDHGFGGDNQKQGKWVGAGPQRRPMVAFLRNLVLGESEDAARNWAALEVVLSHQNEESGEILHETSIMDRSPMKAAISTSFFFSEACYSLLALQSSKNESFLSLQSRLEGLKGQITKSLNYLCSDAVVDYLRADNNHTNRGFFHAKSYLMCGALVGNQRALEIGEEFLQAGLAKQREDGVFPEGGGFDSSYQAVSLLKLAEIYTVRPRVDILDALGRGTNWELGRITRDGEVSAFGNTRTGLKGMSTSSGFAAGLSWVMRKAASAIDGQHVPSKGVNQMEVARGLSLSGIILNDSSILDVASSVMEKAKDKPKNKAKNQGK